MPRTYPLPAAWVQIASGNNPVGSGGSASIVQSTLGLQVRSQVHMILADADVVYCQVRVYSSKGSGQVRMETDKGERQRLDKGLVRPELGPIGFNDKGIEH